MVSHSALLLLALASLRTGEATTTTTVEGSMGTTTTQGAVGTTVDSMAGKTTITGTMTISGITYTDLAADTQMMAQVETECKETIASSAGTNVSPSDVSVTFSAGSLQVTYEILVDEDDASSITGAITSAVDNGSLMSNLVTNLQSIPNIDNIVSGTLSVVADPPTIVEDTSSGASTTSMCTMAAALATIAAVATLHL